MRCGIHPGSGFIAHIISHQNITAHNQSLRSGTGRTQAALKEEFVQPFFGHLLLSCHLLMAA
jgi:hypothetical protein